ncbi:AEC family transporter [Aciduricibacillus chroicocephali]|uniref:AEC family transporter n=1 Tax=Aciduricibacillus chroicocephali TaxID=3054939 RepID=A0ABY9KWP3_9BACI|nr:AEC family transporter [Bacillaceae bacterium 44XB]
MAMGNFLSEMTILYLIGLIGFIARKTGLLSKEANQILTQLILHITLPALILFTLDIPFSYSAIGEFSWLVSMSLSAILVATLIGYYMRKRSRLTSKDGAVYESLIIFGNQGFIGYAISYILFKEQGVIYLTMFNVCYLVHIWAYGIYLFTRNTKKIPWRTIWFNPGIISTFIGFIIFLTPFTWPALISSSLETTGKMTIPLSMIVIGSLIASVPLSSLPNILKNRLLWKATVLRLLIIPLFLLPFILLPVPLTLLIIAVLVTGMPSAPTVSLYAQKYGGDTAFASAGTLLTTLLCIGTLPFLHMLIQILQAFR